MAGTVAWGAKCIRAIRPILRNIIDLYKGLKSPSHHARLPSCIKSDVLFFSEWCAKFNGVTFANQQRSQPAATICTDASLLAGAAHYDNDFVYANWYIDAPCIASAGIYCKELAAVLLALRRWAPLWRNAYIVINTDNNGVLYSIRKGLSKNPLANNILRQILYLCAYYNITYDVSYISTHDNVIADALSRLHCHQYLFKCAGAMSKHNVDLLSPWYNWLYHMSPASMLYIFYRYAIEGGLPRR